MGLGLLAAATWGGSDFAGGLAARRSPALLVVASGHVVTLLVLLALCGGLRLPLPPSAFFLEAAFGGLEGSLALGLFYRSLAMGEMGPTAALTGLLTALVPILYGIWSEGYPSPLAASGLGLGALAIWLIVHPPQAALSVYGTQVKALLFGALAGVGFGLQLILFKLASARGVVWALTSARVGGVLGLGAILLISWPRDKAGSQVLSGFWKLGIAAGVLDTAGNLGYTMAARIGRLDLAAIISSLYPAFTILLAALVMRERPTRRQMVGMAVALVSVVLLSF